MAFGTVPMIVGLVVILLGVPIYLKDMTFGTVPMIVGLVISLSGFALHDLRLVLEFRRP
jgi:flagellar biosynthesis protein FliQ